MQVPSLKSNLILLFWFMDKHHKERGDSGILALTEILNVGLDLGLVAAKKELGRAKVAAAFLSQTCGLDSVCVSPALALVGWQR